MIRRVKKTVILGFLSLMVCSARLVGQDLTSGLVLHYAFDGGLEDSSANGYNGVNVRGGVTFAADRFNVAEKALDPSGAYIAVSDTSSQLNFDYSDDWSIATWVKVADASQTMAFYDKSANDSSGALNLRAGIYNSNFYVLMNINGGDSAMLLSSSTVQANQWMHVCFQKKNDSLRIYVDGRYDNGYYMSDQSPTYANAPANGDSAAIGRYRRYNTEVFYGYIDDIRVYSRALTAGDISTLYHRNSLNFGLVADYPLDGDANDVSGNGRNGTASSGVTPGRDRNNIENGAYRFDGTQGEVTVPGFGSYAPTGEITISLWAKTLASGGNSLFILSPDDGSNRINVHPWWSTDGQLYWDFGTSRLSFSREESLDTWNHYVFVSSYSGQYQRVYLNDSFVGSSTSAGLFTQYAADLKLGGDTISSLYNYHYNGLLDDVKIYDRALDTTEVGALYNSRCTPVALSFSHQEACPGVATTVAETSQSPYASYAWSTGDTTASTTLTVSAASTIWLTVTNTDGCAWADSVVVTAKPEADVTVTADGLCSQDTVTLNTGIIDGMASEGFESGELPSGWVMSGDAGWYVTPDTAYGTGSYSLHSGKIASSGVSDVYTTSTVTTKRIFGTQGTVSFAYMTSSESGYDYLYFYIDGVLQSSTSGATPWSQSSAYTVAAGTHSFTWTYSKDYTEDADSDCVWIDSIVFVSAGASVSGYWAKNGQATDSTSYTLLLPSSEENKGAYTYVSTLDGCQVTSNSVDVTFSAYPTAATVAGTACDTYTLNGTTYSATGTYYQTLTNTMGCDSIITLELVMHQSPVVEIDADADTVCEGDTVVLSATSGAELYAWSTGASSAQASVVAMRSRVYSVTASNGGCASTAEYSGADSVSIKDLYNASNSVIDIAMDSSGVLWEAVDGGEYSDTLKYLSGSNWVDYAVMSGITDIFVGRGDTLWVVTTEGVYGIKNGESTLVWSGGYIWSIGGYDKNGDMWYLHSGEGYALGYYNNGAWNDWQGSAESESEMTVDTAGNLWVSRPGSGITMYDGESWVTFSTESLAVATNNIYHLAADSRGNVYASSDLGLLKYDGSSWTTYDTTNSGLASGTITSLYVDGKDRLWIGMSNSSSENVMYATSSASSITSFEGVQCLDDTTWTSYATENSDIAGAVNQTVSSLSGTRIYLMSDYYVQGLTFPLVIQSQPHATVSAEPSFVCNGTSSVLSVTSGFNYLWDDLTNTLLRAVKPDTTTTYAVTVTTSFGCSEVDTVTVTMPEVSLTATDDTTCAGSQLTLTATGGTSYSWSNGERTGSITVAPGQTTKYFVFINTPEGCSFMDSITITVNTLPVAAIEAASTSVCLGGSTVLSAKDSSIYSYAWSDASAGSTSSIEVAPLVTTTYSVTVSAGACVSTGETTITVDSLTLTLAAADSTVCLGTEAEITASGAQQYSWEGAGYAAAASYAAIPEQDTWYHVEATSGSCVVTDSIQITINALPAVELSAARDTVCSSTYDTLVVTGAATNVYEWDNNVVSAAGLTAVVQVATSTTYSVTAVDANGCSSTDTTFVEARVSPYFDISLSADRICLGSETDLWVDTTRFSSPFTIEWNTGDSGDSLTLSPVESTTYSATVTDAYGCQGTGEAYVDVVPAPVVSLQVSEDTICAGSATTLLASGGKTYRWSTGSTDASITVAPTATTMYYVVAKGSVGCTVDDSIEVTVRLSPELVVSTSRSMICSGDSVEISASGLSTYAWSNDVASSSQYVSPVSSTTYSVTGTDSIGCSQSSSVSVTVNDKPSVGLAATSDSICQGAETITLTTGVQDARSYFWSTGSTAGSISIAPLESTRYYVNVISKEGCPGTDSVWITVLENPVVTVAASENAICSGIAVSLSATGSGSYAWSTGDTTSSVSVTPGTTSAYSVTVTTADGCVGSAGLSVNVLDVYAVEISDTIRTGEEYNGVVRTESVVLVDKLSSASGCDSIVTTTLTVLPYSQRIDTILTCLPEGDTLAGTGRELSVIEGDSIFTTYYIYNTSYTRYDTLLLAEDGTIVLPDGSIKNEAGVYTTTFLASTGCDSTITTTVLEATGSSSYLAFEESQVSLVIDDTYSNAVSVFPQGEVDSSTLVWTSTDSTVATVDQDGNVVALSVGHAKIVLMAQGGSQVSSSYDVYVYSLVDKTPLENAVQKAQSLVDLLEERGLVGDSTSEYLAAQVQELQDVIDSTGTYLEDDNITISMVDSLTTLVTNAIVSLLQTNSGYVPVATVEVIPGSVSLDQANTTTVLVASIFPTEATIKDVTWESSDETVVTVDDQGVLTPVSSGTAHVRAISVADPSLIDSAEVIVTILAEEITMPDLITMLDGHTSALNPVVVPSNAICKTLVYTSDDTSVVTIDSAGVITSVAPGVANIIVSTLDGAASAVCAVFVSDVEVPVSSVAIADSLVTLISGLSEAVAADVYPLSATNKTLAWSVGNSDIAVVSSAGVILGVSPGSTTVYVQTEDGAYVDSIVVVVQPSESPVVTPATTMLQAGSDSVAYSISELVSDDNTLTADIEASLAESTPNFTVEIVAGQVIIRPVDTGWVGTDTVLVAMTDKDGQTSVVSITVTVSTKANEAPVITQLPDQAIMLGGVFATMSLTDNVTDDYTRASNIAWTCSSTSHVGALIYGGLIQPMVLDNTWIGTDTLVLTAIDESGLRASIEIHLTISNNPNTAPRISSIPDQVKITTGTFSAVNLKSYVEDDYTLPANISWSVSSSSKLCVYVLKGVAYIKILDANWVGTETFYFTAKDAEGLYDIDTVSISNQATTASTWLGSPRVTFSADRTLIAPGESVSFYGTITGATSWRWELAGAATATSNSLNPIITYTTPGLYTVKLLAMNSIAKDSLVVEKYIAVLGIGQRDAMVCKGQSTTLSITDSTQYSFAWSTGSAAASVVVSPAVTSSYAVTITKGLFTYVDSVTVTVNQPVWLGADTALCAGEDLTLDAGLFASYAWTGPVTATTGSINPTQTGDYTVNVVDADGCASTDSKSVEFYALPQVDLGSDDSVCLNSIYTLDAGLASTYSWSTGESTRRLTITAATSRQYSVTVTNSDGCVGQDSLYLSVLAPYSEQIALVTHSEVDPQDVIIAWQKTANMHTWKYIVYRETGELDDFSVKIGERLFDQMSYLIDSTADLSTKAYRYRLTTIDSTCQNQAVSDIHKTIHLQTSATTDGGIGLSWNAYVGLPVATYRIIKFAADGTSSQIDSISNSGDELSYTDYTQPLDGVSYQVRYKLTDTIDLTTLKSDSGPYSQSLSNIAESELLGSDVTLLPAGVSLFPNPTGGKFSILIDGAWATDYSVAIVSAIGQEVFSTEVKNTTTAVVEVDNSLPPGVYSVVISTVKASVTKQLIISK